MIRGKQNVADWLIKICMIIVRRYYGTVCAKTVDYSMQSIIYVPLLSTQYFERLKHIAKEEKRYAQDRRSAES